MDAGDGNVSETDVKGPILSGSQTSESESDLSSENMKDENIIR